MESVSIVDESRFPPVASSRYLAFRKERKLMLRSALALDDAPERELPAKIHILA